MKKNKHTFTIQNNPEKIGTTIITGNTMRKLKINNWALYGKDYMFFAKLVDETKECIMLQTTSGYIIATGKETSLLKFTDLLNKNNIQSELL